jgi:DNA polymerase elongation subunit (family B)
MPINLSPNELIRERHFLVTKKEAKQTRSGDTYYQLELSDPTGKVEAKIWGNNLGQCNFDVGKVVELNGKTQEYNGKLSLIIDSCQVVENASAQEFSTITPTLVFDIETVGKKFEELDHKEQDYLLHNLNKDDDEEIAKSKTALWSLFGFVCAIGCYNPHTNKGMVLALTPGEALDLKPESEDYIYKSFATEKELLEEFWKIAESYEKFVTYNGDSFDFPYLVIRSGINRVKVPIQIKKWSEDIIDLQNKFKQSNRSFKLEMLCKAFGVENPKEAGVSGGDVAVLFDQKEYNTIADYVSRDAYSTSKLYLVWKEFMSGEKY